MGKLESKIKKQSSLCLIDKHSEKKGKKVRK